MSDLSNDEIADLLALPEKASRPFAPSTDLKASPRATDGDIEPNAYMLGVAWAEQWPRPNARCCDAEKAAIKANTIEMLSRGITMTKIGLAHNISQQAITMWAKSDVDFNDKLNYANEAFNNTLADGLLDVHNRHFNPAMAAVESKNTQWLLGVRDRNKYGTKVEVVDSNAGLVDVLKAAIARIPRPDGGPMLDLTKVDDAQVIDVDDLLALPPSH